MRSRNHIDRIPRRLLQSIATKQEQPKTEPKPPQFFRISPRQYSIPPAPGAAGRPAAPRAPDHPLPLPRHHCDLFPHFASGGRNRAKDPTTSRRRPVHWYFLRSRSTNKGKDRIFLLFLFLLTLLSSLVGAMSSTLLRVSPSELKIPYEVKRQRSCCMQLINKTDKYVAFKVKTTNPRKYSVRHTCGILLPRSSCSVRVTMQAPKEMQLDYHCKDKFLVQSAVARDGATMKDFVPELFIRAPGRLIEEFKLRVVYIAANPPSPVPEEAEEEDALPASEAIGCEAKIPSTFDAASRPRYINSSGAKLSCAEGASVVSTLVGDGVGKVDENHKLEQDMELLREARSSQHGFSVIFVLFVFMSSVFIGHLMKHIKV